MKYLILMAIVLFSGCSTASLSKMYDTTKVIYVKGKEVVVTNSDLLSDDLLSKLSEIDEQAISLDKEVKKATKMKRKGFIVSEAVIIALISAVIGAYAQKETNVTQYIYHDDGNNTTFLWIKDAD